MLLSLTGCGFHLRGIETLPSWFNNVAIISAPQNKPLVMILKHQLDAYNVHVVEDPSCANYWLHIKSATFKKSVISISSSTTPRQYLLVYTIVYDLEKAQGKVIKENTTIEVTRQITINSDRILGSNAEETITKNEMRRDAAFQILHRISK